MRRGRGRGKGRRRDMVIDTQGVEMKMGEKSRSATDAASQGFRITDICHLDRQPYQKLPCLTKRNIAFVSASHQTQTCTAIPAEQDMQKSPLHSASRLGRKETMHSYP